MPVVMIKPRISPLNNAPRIAAMFSLCEPTDDETSNYLKKDLLNDRQSSHEVKLKSKKQEIKCIYKTIIFVKLSIVLFKRI